MILAVLLFAAPMRAQEAPCYLEGDVESIVRLPPPPPPPAEPDPFAQRLLKYADIAVRHRLTGLASYYSGFFDGRKTANGEIYRNRRFSAAHLTLPLGCWVEVTARATGKKLRLRVNDRGPYAHKFTIDLSQAAARYLGVDRAPDRHVDIRIIALPGEEPLPDEVLEAPIQVGSVMQNVAPSPIADSTVISPP
jgi:rare lipoprotein A